MRKWINYSFGFIMIAGLWSFGFIQGSTSWDGIVYNQSKKPTRQLASVGAHLDFSNITEIYPAVFEKQSVFDKAYITEDLNGIQIHLGHISTKSSSINLVCEHYSHLQLTLKSSDININGEPLEMKLTALCNVSKDIGLIDPIHLPLKKIKQLESNNFQKEGVFLENSYFLHMSSEWMITQVKFFSKKGRTLPELLVKAKQAVEVNLP